MSAPVLGAAAAGIGALGGTLFGGFAPFPNSIMIPFMGAQSAVLAYNFGIYYELGKRTVKSLDNDFFNKIRANSADEITVIDNGQEIKMKYNQYISYLTKRNSQQMISDFRNIIPDFQSLQNDIIEQTVQIELKKADRTPSAMVEMYRIYEDSTAREVSKESGVPQGTRLEELLYFILTGKSTAGVSPPVDAIPDPEITIEHKDIIGHERHPEHGEVITPPNVDDRPEPEPTAQFSLRFTVQYTDRITGVTSTPLTINETHNLLEWNRILAYWRKLMDGAGPKHIQYNYYKAYYTSIQSALLYSKRTYV